MKEMSARGFYYVLEKSPYRVFVKDRTFVFPSEFRKQRFLKLMEKEKKRLKDKEKKLGVKLIYSNTSIAHGVYDIVQPAAQLILEGEACAEDPMD